MKVLFLDIDGVLTSARTGWYNMDVYAVNFISHCCREAGYRIVISSTWRKNHDKGFWDCIFPDLIHDHWDTPIGIREQVYATKHDTRGAEIDLWLQLNPDVIEYVILDDDTDFKEEQKSRFVQTDSGDGLLLIHMFKMRELMGIDSYNYDQLPMYQHPKMFNHTTHAILGD